MKNYAVVDIGSLKTKLLIANKGRERINILEKKSDLTLMGKGIKENEHKILEKPLRETISSVKRYLNISKKYKVENVKIIATESLRKAENLERALKIFKAETGMIPKIISQKDEARVYFKAITWNMKKNYDIVVIDIGGGSVQVLYGNKNNLKEMFFLPLGTYYMHQNFIKDNSEKGKATKKELSRIRKHIGTEIKKIKIIKGIEAPLVYGSSNIVELSKFLKFDLQKVKFSQNHHVKFEPIELIKFMKKIENLNHKEREKMYPFQYGYMWGIQIAFYTVYYLARHIDTKEVVPSNVNIAEGYILENYS